MDRLQQNTLIGLAQFLKLQDIGSQKQTIYASAFTCGLALSLIFNRRLRKLQSKKSLVNEPSRFNRRLLELTSPLEFDEYDIIITGGGKTQN
jgi:hypothetical protein